MAIPNMTKKDLAVVSGLTYRRLYDIDQELPDDKKLFVPASDGKFSLPLFVRRWIEYSISKATASETSYQEAKTKHEIVKTAKTELEVARLRGQLIDVQDVRKLWGDIAVSVVQNALTLPKKLAPILVMQDNEAVISGIIEDEIRVMLEGIADTPLPSYVADEEEAGEEEAE